MTKKAIILVCLVLLTACKGEPEFPARLHVSQPELRETFQACADYWEDLLGEPVFTVTDEPWEDNGSCSDVPVRVTDLPLRYCAFTWEQDACERKIQVQPIPSCWGMDTACHELGHLLQIPHNDDKRNIMYPNGDQKLGTTPEQIALAKRTVARY